MATRALEALEAGSVAVHDALHSLLECCLQLHPAAARHLYEAAKKVPAEWHNHGCHDVCTLRGVKAMAAETQQSSCCCQGADALRRGQACGCWPGTGVSVGAVRR